MALDLTPTSLLYNLADILTLVLIVFDSIAFVLAVVYWLYMLKTGRAKKKS